MPKKAAIVVKNEEGKEKLIISEKISEDVFEINILHFTFASAFEKGVSVNVRQ